MEDLDFADDMCFISSNKEQMQRKTTRLETIAHSIGLDIKVMILAINNNCTTPKQIEDHGVREVDNFKHLSTYAREIQL